MVCEESNNFVFCEIDGVINIGRNVANSSKTGLVSDVFGTLDIPFKTTFQGSPRYVEVLSMSAFAHASMKKVYIPYTITKIMRDAFLICRNLKEVVFAENPKLTEIQQGAFFNLPSLQKLWIPSSVEQIQFDAFGYFSSRHLYYCGYHEFTSDIFRLSTGTPFIHVPETYPSKLFGRVEISDRSFDCYYQKFYQTKPIVIEKNTIVFSKYAFILLIL